MLQVSTLILVVASTIYGVEVEKLTNMDADFFTVQEIACYQQLVMFNRFANIP